MQPVVGNIYVYIDDNHVSGPPQPHHGSGEVFQRAAEGGWLVNGKWNFKVRRYSGSPVLFYRVR